MRPNNRENPASLSEAEVSRRFDVMRRPKIQSRERVDLPGVRDGRDGPENALRLVDARAVVRMNAPKIGSNDFLRRDLSIDNRLLNLRDRLFLDVERLRSFLRPVLTLTA